MQGGLKHTIQQIASTSNQLASAAEELSAVTVESTRGLVRRDVPALSTIGYHCHGLAVELHDGTGQALTVW